MSPHPAILGAEHTWRRHYGLPHDDYSRFHPPLLHQSISKKPSPHLHQSYSLFLLVSIPKTPALLQEMRRIRNVMAAAGAPSLQERKMEGGRDH